MWRPIKHVFPDLNAFKLPPKLENVTKMPIHQLIRELNDIKLDSMSTSSPMSPWLIVGMIIMALLLTLGVVMCLVRRKYRMIRFTKVNAIEPETRSVELLGDAEIAGDRVDVPQGGETPAPRTRTLLTLNPAS